jgi:hypothetical protein
LRHGRRELRENSNKHALNAAVFVQVENIATLINIEQSYVFTLCDGVREGNFVGIFTNAM